MLERRMKSYANRYHDEMDIEECRARYESIKNVADGPKH